MAPSLLRHVISEGRLPTVAFHHQAALDSLNGEGKTN